MRGEVGRGGELNVIDANSIYQSRLSLEMYMSQYLRTLLGDNPLR